MLVLVLMVSERQPATIVGKVPSCPVIALVVGTCRLANEPLS